MKTFSFPLLHASFLGLLLASVIPTPNSRAQTSTQLLPLVLTGYNADVIADGTYDGTAASVTGSTTAVLDNKHDYYVKGFNPSFPDVGLPADNTFTSAANPDATFLIQPADGSNVLLLTDLTSSAAGGGVSSGTLALSSPGSFTTLAVLVTGLDSSNPVSYTLRFADGGATTQGTFVAPDNAVGSGQVALSGFGRVSRVDGTFDTDQDEGQPILFEVDIPLSSTDSGRALTNITFANLCPDANGSSPRRVAIFGVSGYSTTADILQPIVLSGYNQDVIADLGSSAADSTTTTIDSAHDYYVPGFDPDLSTGLPAGSPIVSAANPNTVFYLQPSAGNNVLLFPDQGTLTLATPGAWSNLAVLTTGLNGSLPVNYQLVFTDGGASTLGSFTAPDNVQGTGQIAFSGFGRVNRADGTFDSPTGVGMYPRLYEADITLSAADAARPLGSIVFTDALPGTDDRGNPQKVAIFGVSGVALTAPVGTLAFAQASYTVKRDVGNATVTVTRTGGSSGELSISCATANGTAKSGIDYTATSGTLTWLAGDTTPKTFTVPIHAATSSTGNVTLLVNLTSADSSILGTPTQAKINIVPSTAADPIRELSMLSPPSDISVVQNQTIEFYASVVATQGASYQVEYVVSDDSGATPDLSLGTFTNARNHTLWTPSQPGNFHLQLVATQPPDTTVLGHTAQPITVVAAASSTDAGPQVSLLGGLGGLQFAADDMVTLVASAVNSDGTPLSKVNFYADGQLLGTAPVVARAPQPGSGGKQIKDGSEDGAYAYFTTQLSAALQLITATGENSQGVSGVSSGVTLYTKSAAATGLSCAIVGPTNNATLYAEQSGLTATVNATNNAGIVAKVQMFRDGLYIGSLTQAPFVFTLPPLGAGTHVLSAIATDANAVSATSTPVIVNAVSVPTVTVLKAGDGMAVEGGEKGKLFVYRTGATDAPLTVNYAVKGDAVAGVDYKGLTGSVTFAAGSSKAKIKIKPLTNETVPGTRKVKVKLLPASDGSYELGDPAVAKIKVVDNG